MYNCMYNKNCSGFVLIKAYYSTLPDVVKTLYRNFSAISASKEGEWDMELSEKIKKCRIECGLSQAALAEKIGSTTRSISAYESGARKPRPEKLEKLAQVLGVSTIYLNDPTCYNRYEGIERDEYISRARKRYGHTGAVDVEALLAENQSLFAGGDLSENQKDQYFHAVTELYFQAKEEASRKFGSRRKEQNH